MPILPDAIENSGFAFFHAELHRGERCCALRDLFVVEQCGVEGG